MGPPPFGDGNRRASNASFHRRAASMGPPPFGDGNSPESTRTRTAIPRFNGATAFRRWKHHGIHAGQPAGRLASMGPPPFGDGNMTATGQSASSPSGFNGATAFRRWKLALWSVRPRTWLALQWGGGHPPPFGDGNLSNALSERFQPIRLQWGHRLSAMETPPACGFLQHPYQCFNGATAFQRWKPTHQAQSLARRLSLQWGHRLSAMETRQPWPPLPAHHTASMGPPPFGDGNVTTGGSERMASS